MDVPDPLLPTSIDVTGRDGVARSLAWCPFCSGIELYVECDAVWADQDTGPTLWVVCDACGTSGPIHDSEAGAIDGWNDRTAALPLHRN